MANILFQFVSLRGSQNPAVTTQDIATSANQTFAAGTNFKPALQLTEAEQKQVRDYRFRWLKEDGSIPLPNLPIPGFLFRDIAANGQAFLISRDEYINAANDLEIILYRERLSISMGSTAEQVQALKRVLLVNAYVLKKELQVFVTGSTAVGDVQVQLPVRVLIGRKYDRKPNVQKPGSDIQDLELYKDDKKLLKEIASGRRVDYNAQAVAEKVKNDSQAIRTLVTKLSSRIDDVKQQQALVVQKTFTQNATPQSSVRPGLISRAFNSLFGGGSSRIQQTAEIPVNTVIDLNQEELLTTKEKTLLSSLGFDQQRIDETSLQSIMQHQLELDMQARKVRATGSQLTPVRFEEIPPLYFPLPPAGGPPTPPLPPPVPVQRPEIRNACIADLYRVEEKTVAYQPTEISFIENVMSSETKKRLHINTKEIETITETELEEEEESEKDLTTTNRFNLKSETEKSLKEDFNLKAGINTSGKYGPVQVDTTTQFSFQKTSEQSSKEAVETANEVVSKAVERTKKKTRQLLKITERLKLSEENTHSFENPATNPHINGIYQFVDKIKEVSLMHYGKRLMLEFYIPEPAMTILQKVAPVADPDYPDPGVFDLQVDDIQTDSYTGLAARFGIGSLETPPPEFLSTSFSFKSSVDEAADEWANETAEGKILIPTGYASDTLFYSFAGHTNDTDEHAACHVAISVGGASIIDVYAKHLEFSRSMAGIESSEGLAVSIRLTDHYDKVATVNLRLRCRRTPSFLDAWRLRIFQQCKQRFDELKGIYLRKKEEARFTDPEQDLGGSALENRAVIEKELKKWCIKALRGLAFNFDDTVLVGGMEESDPFSSLDTQPFIWFHENSFEWSNIVYLFYPYFWGRRDKWRERLAVKENDELFREFLQAGYAKVIVPVNPDANPQVMKYLDDPTIDEADLYNDSMSGASANPFADLWMELLQDKVDGLARGSGTLSVTNASTTVQINSDSDWELTVDDINRVLVIEGIEYVIKSFNSATHKQFDMDKPYERSTNSTARYFIRGKLIGSPWRISVPTELTYLTNKNIDQIPG